MHQAGYGFKYGAFARAVCAYKGNYLPFVHLKAYALDGVYLSVVNVNIVHFKHGSHFYSSSLPRYASITTGLFLISSGVPFAIMRP